MPIDIRQWILNLPLPVIKRMKLEREYILAVRPIKKALGREIPRGKFCALLDSNRWYGNEYLLRRYAGINEDLYAIIEHGLFFGNNTAKVPHPLEWELGCILTYGDYRKELINRVHPDYYCETVGAPILYADDDECFQQRIRDDLQIAGKTLLFFPAHGQIDLMQRFDIESLVDRLIMLASENECKSIIVCTYFTDDELYRQLRNKAHGIKITTYSCGDRYDQDFLLRQHALISLSDVTVSNSLGTHVGNCVGLHKPHVIVKQEITYKGNIRREFGKEMRSDNWKDQFAIETAMFEKMFAPTGGKVELTQEQYQFCDYYWGFSKKKTPEEIRAIYRNCREHAMEYMKR